MKKFNNFIKKIKNKKVKVGIIGMGYVGLPLSILISKRSYEVYGFDEDISKINKDNNEKLLMLIKNTAIDHINIQRGLNDKFCPTTEYKTENVEVDISTVLKTK